MKFFALALFALSTSTAMACSCQRWGTAQEMLKRHSEAFIAIAESDSVEIGVSTEPSEGKLYRTKFSVVRDYKRRNKTVEVVSFENNGANCGITFKKDDGVWLLFADKYSGKLNVSGCTVGSATDEGIHPLVRGLNKL